MIRGITDAYPELERERKFFPLGIEGAKLLTPPTSCPLQGTRGICGLAMRFLSADVRAYNGWNQHSIVCCGADPSDIGRTIRARRASKFLPKMFKTCRLPLYLG
jgi:hypothetical protein